MALLFGNIEISPPIAQRFSNSLIIFQYSIGIDENNKHSESYIMPIGCNMQY
jgi:hypothetical protein